MSGNHLLPRAQRLQRRGMTLFELVVCMGITSFLVLGLASAVRLTVTSLEGSTDANATLQDTGDALNRLNADLRLALQFSERTASAVTFTVPDQNGDGVTETVRYAWAGVGSPLTRAVNGAPVPASILDNVQTLNFSVLTRTIQPPKQNSGVWQLIAYNGTSTSININSTSWVGEYFLPSLPANSVSYNISRLRLFMKVGTLINLGNVRVSIFNAGGNKLPAGAALGSYTLPLLSLSTSLAPIDIPFATLNNLTPGQPLFLQVSTPTNPLTPVSIAIKEDVSPVPANMTYFTSADQGSSWGLPAKVSSVKYQVYGVVTMQGP
jgi:hypothetical protein